MLVALGFLYGLLKGPLYGFIQGFGVKVVQLLRLSWSGVGVGCWTAACDSTHSDP